ncbi:hypothetical protein BSL78_02957 [Apostichopus japonicus]|uniref:Uncharacterized protein n=2 Tax=Stichopus japonicus TaxID=307972 RepID=A0A2G8LIQ8_STIJA|nr:hypothetical protein BSL78_02957 [Apostichopus japonicus]
MAEPTDRSSGEKEIFKGPCVVQEKHIRAASAIQSASTDHHQYKDKRADLEYVNKQLVDMKERLMENIYKVHLLQVDLASQFDPHVVEIIRSSETSCSQCAASITEGH